MSKAAKMLKLKEACEILHMSDSTMRRMIKRKQFTAFRLNERGDIGIAEDEVHRYLAKRQIA